MKDPDVPANADAAPVRELHTALDHGDSERISEAVRLAEENSSSEIIVKLSAATADGDMREIAQTEFLRLGLGTLKPDNGILVYVSLNRHAVEIVVGADACARLPQELWARAAASIADGFRNSKPADGIITAIGLMTDPLRREFPPLQTPGPELPNVSEGP